MKRLSIGAMSLKLGVGDLFFLPIGLLTKSANRLEARPVIVDAKVGATEGGWVIKESPLWLGSIEAIKGRSTDAGADTGTIISGSLRLAVKESADISKESADIDKPLSDPTEIGTEPAMDCRLLPISVPNPPPKVGTESSPSPILIGTPKPPVAGGDNPNPADEPIAGGLAKAGANIGAEANEGETFTMFEVGCLTATAPRLRGLALGLTVPKFTVTLCCCWFRWF